MCVLESPLTLTWITRQGITDSTAGPARPNQAPERDLSLYRDGIGYGWDIPKQALITPSS